MLKFKTLPIGYSWTDVTFRFYGVKAAFRRYGWRGRQGWHRARVALTVRTAVVGTLPAGSYTKGQTFPVDRD